ncbi:hypothetical protein G4B88_002439, partial [Cannabis sativa]
MLSRIGSVRSSSLSLGFGLVKRWLWSKSDTGQRFAVLWGNGDYGRLGLGSLDSHWSPAPVLCSAFRDQGLRAIACGGAHTLFLTEVSGLPKEIVRISAGYYHSGAITVDGELYMWGKNANGQLGLGKRAPKAVPLPTKVESLIGLTIKMAALGSEHSVAVTDGGEALSWGGGEYGRLGHANDSTSFSFFKSTSEYMPRLIKKLEGIKGFRENSEATPSLIAELPYSEEVACGGYHTTTMVFHQPERVQGPFSECIVSQVSCGWKHTAAISEGKVFTWGWGGSHGTFSVDGHSSGGQLGHGNDVDYMKPTMINLGGDVKAFQALYLNISNSLIAMICLILLACIILFILVVLYWQVCQWLMVINTKNKNENKSLGHHPTKLN